MGRNLKMGPKGKLVSVIIPAYKAEDFIEKSLIGVISVLDQIRYKYEIICVVDGTSIDRTFEKAQKIEHKFPNRVKALGYLNNLGKGHAVRYGMAQAKGEIIGFVDAGMDLDLNGLSMLLEHFEWYDADIIVGSKRHPASKVTYPWQRRIMSFGYQIGVRLLFGLKVKDTQVGMKMFKREVLERTLPRLLVKAFAFDIEILTVANYLGYSKIYEAPVELNMKFKGGSTIVSKGFLNTAWRMACESAAVFYRLRILNFYDSKNRSNWITPQYLVLKKKATTLGR